MKIVWLLNGLVGRASVLYNHSATQSGGWINATFEQIADRIQDGAVELHTVAPVKQPKEPIQDEAGDTYHYVEWSHGKMGQKPSGRDKARLWKLLDDLAPNCIMLWGTEYPIAYSAALYAREHGIPLLLYVQGVVGSFQGHFNGDLPLKQERRGLSLIDKIKTAQARSYYRALMKQKKHEDEIYRCLHGVISDNDWCFSMVKAVNPQVVCYKHLLPLNRLFSEGKWSAEKASSYEIFTIAGRTPYKGLHNLIMALPTIKEAFPQVQVYIPGYMGYGRPAFLKRPPYMAYLQALIKGNRLEEQVHFVGKLDAEQMRTYMERCACFVMPSIVENHSSSLREAMLVGAPCVSAAVGSVEEFMEDGVSGLVYHDHDCEALADAVIKLLRSRDYAESIAAGGREAIRRMYEDVQYQNVYEIYEEVIGKL